MSAPRQSWGDFYAGSGDLDYFLDHLAIHKDFLKEILASKPASSLEAGCGSAIMSVFLAMTGVRACACDRDQEVLKKASQIADNWKTTVHFSRQDILRLDFANDSFDVVFSQGVLEHLSDDQIRQAARESLRVARRFVFSVPGRAYRHRDFGDERLLGAEQWQNILSGCGKARLRGYYQRRTKKNFLLRRPLMLMGVLER